MKKGGEMPIFSPIGKKYAYFFPNWQQIYKIAQTKPEKFAKFACGTHPLFISNFIWGKNINQDGAGPGAKIWI